MLKQTWISDSQKGISGCFDYSCCPWQRNQSVYVGARVCVCKCFTPHPLPPSLVSRRSFALSRSQIVFPQSRLITATAAPQPSLFPFRIVSFREETIDLDDAERRRGCSDMARRARSGGRQTERGARPKIKRMTRPTCLHLADVAKRESPAGPCSPECGSSCD